MRCYFNPNVLLVLITYINCASVSLAMKLQTYFTVAKLLALTIIIGAGVYNIATGKYTIVLHNNSNTALIAICFFQTFFRSRWAFGHGIHWQQLELRLIGVCILFWTLVT